MLGLYIKCNFPVLLTYYHHLLKYFYFNHIIRSKINQKLLDTILKIQDVSKTYQSAGRTLTVLGNINFSVDAGSTMSIVGPSGSGKTTLLGLCAGLDRSSSGVVELNNIRLDALNED